MEAVKNAIINIFNTHTSFVITSHVNPDGDALGSSLGLGLVLRNAGKSVAVVLRGFQRKFANLQGMEMVVAEYVHDPESGPPVLVCVDCANAERALVGGFERFDDTINIDHHISNTLYAAHNLVDAECAAATEVVLNLISGAYPVTKPIAELLLMGLLRDTGGFRHSNTKITTLQTAIKLMELGADIAEVSKRHVNCRTIPETRIFARALDNIKLLDEGQICVSHLTLEDYEKAGASHEDNEGIAEHLLEIEGVAVAMLFTQRGNGVKINFRSAVVNVGVVAAKFGGGGHKAAAGTTLLEGNIFDIMESAVALVREEIGRHG